MKRLTPTFNFFDQVVQNEAIEDAERLEDWDPYRDNNYSTSSSPGARAGSLPPMYPGRHALDTLNMYMDDASDHEEPPATASPPGGVAVALEAATISTDPEHRTPAEARGRADTAVSTNSHEAQDSPSDSTDSSGSSGSGSIDLNECNAEQRAALYEQAYSDVTCTLRDFCVPDQYNAYPKHAPEILSAFLEHATFTVKVWANYDSYTRKLYRQPSRVDSCGKLQLPAKQRKYLNTFSRVQFSNIVMEVGTPFRTLAKIRLKAVNGELEVGGSLCKDVHSPHQRLKRVVVEAMKRIKEDGVVGEQYGLTLKDLGLIAKEFVYLPKNQRDIWEYFEN